MTQFEFLDFLKRHGLSEHQFAKAIGYTGPSADHWARGRRPIPLIVVKLCKTFDQYPQLLPWFGVLK